MCRLLAYSGPPLALDTLLVEPRRSLVSQSLAAREAKTVVNGDGCGIGWYGHRPEPGIYRGILPAWSDQNLASLCRTVASHLFVAHVRSATSGEVSLANCHPFASGRHVFLHNGQVGGYDAIRRRVDALIPDELFHLRRGTGDSEALFLAALGRGLTDDPVGAVMATLAAVAAIAKTTGRPTRFAAIHSDGETLHAFRWASDGRPPTIYWRRHGEGVVIASEPCEEDGAGWAAVPPATVLTVQAGGAVGEAALTVPERLQAARRRRTPPAASAVVSLKSSASFSVMTPPSSSASTMVTARL